MLSNSYSINKLLNNPINNNQYVIKRDGRSVLVSFDKILFRVRNIAYNNEQYGKLKPLLPILTNVNPEEISKLVTQRIIQNISTQELDVFTASICSDKSAKHPEYLQLASRIIISNHHKNTSHIKSFSFLIKEFENHSNNYSKNKNRILKESLSKFVIENAEKIDNYIDYNRDYLLQYFGFCTLLGKYLLQIKSNPVSKERYTVGSKKWLCERPQDLFMRLALSLYQNDLDSAFKMYDDLSMLKYSHATPTLYNAGTPFNQLASCFLVGQPNDSISGIFEKLKDCAEISKYAGGIGMNIHSVRSKNSYIYGTNGESNGIIPMLRVYNNMVRYVDQCFTSDTLVYTKTGLKKFSFLSKSDFVLNAFGNWTSINEIVLHSKNEFDMIDFVKIETNITDPVIVTKKHPILSINNQYNTNINKLFEQQMNDEIVENTLNFNEELERKKRYDEKTNIEIKNDKLFDGYEDADNLCKGDFIKFPLYKLQNIKNKENKNSFYFIYGRIIYNLVFISDNENIIQNLSEYKNNKYFWTKEQFFNDENKIYINKEYFNEISSNEMIDFIIGLQHEYLHHYTCNENLFFKKNKNLNSKISKNLLIDFQFIFFKCSILSSISDEQLMIVPGMIDFFLKNNGKTIGFSNSDCFVTNKFMFVRINKISEYQSSNHNYLYDLEVENGSSYVVNGLTVHNGGGKRKGSIAVYLEVWHADIEDFLQIRKNNGNPEERCRDLFNALWVCDLFMMRILNNDLWSLFDPAICPDLDNCYGLKFNELYIKYENEKKYIKQIRALDLWNEIIRTQVETGLPYMMYKDACNFKSNQRSLGTIKSSNLCTEIIEYSSKDETAVCNLASINLKLCIKEKLIPVNITDLVINVYSVNDCSYCKLAIAFLKKKLIRLREEYTNDTNLLNKPILNVINISTNDDINEAKKMFKIHESEIITFPKIIFKNTNSIENDIIINGYNELLENFGFELDKDKLGECTRQLTRNLNRIIDQSFYPLESCKRSNKYNRPIGIGVQGLADFFFILKIPFDSDKARLINHEIFECIYFNAIDESCELAIQRTNLFQKVTNYIRDNFFQISNSNVPLHYYDIEEYDVNNSDSEFIEMLKKLQLDSYDFEMGFNDKMFGAYKTFNGSPLSEGKFQFDLCDEFEKYRNNCGFQSTLNNKKFDFNYNFDQLRIKVMKNGVRNSLLLAPMPTASTSQILGNNECFEPITNNYYIRRTLNGDFIVINDYLINDLIDLDVWNRGIKDFIIEHGGSIQQLNIPKELKNIYKTVFEISKKVIIDMAADRGRFICQSQSMNLHVSNNSYENISKIHFMGFLRGLKTGMYYLHTLPAAKAANFTSHSFSKNKNINDTNNEVKNEICDTCSA